ncbi:TonB-dependent outer membrane siderophore receptor [Acetobacter malorum]|uniref:TonB-dependent outer membrane siderophore receptor n=1 Tax=Acetobacter malorum TaxID=178901 RepID=A0A177GFS7_9PROT|nr:hypothetical protein [Acetobacter malorum]OAG78315.1 TonB-dependent outer membrane siderophore receptor [Acetobacter malorum]
MSHTDRRKTRLPLSFSLLYALPVFAAGAPAFAQAATATSPAVESTHQHHCQEGHGEESCRQVRNTVFC